MTGWTARCIAIQRGVQVGPLQEGLGSRLLDIDGSAGGTKQDAGVCAAVGCDTRH